MVFSLKQCWAPLLATAAVLAAQGQPAEVRIRSAPYQPLSATISVETNLVEVGVSVRDSKGAAVGGLQASDFQLFDNLKPQTITFFSEQRAERPHDPKAPVPNAPPVSGAPPPTSAPPPRYIALFFDDTHAGMAGFVRSKKAAEKLITDGLRPGDRMGIYTGSGAVELDFTGDTKTLLSTLAALKRHPERGSSTGFSVCPTLTAYQAFLITEHLDPRAKAIATAEVMGCEPGIPYEIAEEQAQTAGETVWVELRNQSLNIFHTLQLIVRHLAAAPGSRMLLMVSPGFVTGDMQKQTAALIDACLRDHIVVNALDDEGLLSSGLESPESLGQRVGMRADWADRTLGLRMQIITSLLSEAAESTGGKFIHNNNDLTGGLMAAAAIPEVSYLLGFGPSGKPDDKYHKLKVTTAKTANYRVSARPGYFAALAGDRPETAQQHIDRLVASGELPSQIAATVKVGSVGLPGGQYRIEVEITLDAKRLRFGSKANLSLQQLTFVTVLEDAAGNYIAGKQAVMDMELSRAKRADLEANGIKAATSFLVPKGSYRVREVIREAVQNHLSASVSPVEIK